ncbi:MAG: hypothetical protein RIR28_198 [Pseudomonadota bacterium]
MNEAYVLHSLAWRETSLIVEVLTRAEGRLGLVARGARRPRSALRGLLQPFQPIMVRYASKGELRTLMAAEWQGGMPVLSGEALLAGFYLNELIMRLLPRQDAHPMLFDAYRSAVFGLASLSRGELGLIEPILRQFECRLLREMGVLPSFDAGATRGQRVAWMVSPCQSPWCGPWPSSMILSMFSPSPWPTRAWPRRPNACSGLSCGIIWVGQN